MFVPDTFPIALLMMVTSMICWGSWANTYKLTKGYRFELFYWDYAIGIFLISLVLALTLGSMGSTPETTIPKEECSLGIHDAISYPRGPFQNVTVILKRYSKAKSVEKRKPMLST